MIRIAPRPARVVTATLALVLASCGAKTGLEIEPPDAEAPRDAGMDAGPDAAMPPDGGVDAGPDANVCVPGTVRLERSEIEVVFVVDRSGSMLAAYDGGPATGSEPSRWELLEDALGDALAIFDEAVGVGAKFFPSRSARVAGDCEVFDGLDVGVGPGRAPAVVSQFSRWNPAGGTPVGSAAREALDALLARASPTRAQFIVVATDGQPTCSFGAADQIRSVVGEAHETHGIDVFVVGIASTDPEVLLLDQIAVLGGRARPESEGARFYDARDPELLNELLGEITRDLAQCVFAVPRPPGEEDTVEVSIDGDVVTRDAARTEGWDWTSDLRGQLSLFGEACERARAGGAVRAIITCGP